MDRCKIKCGHKDIHFCLSSISFCRYLCLSLWHYHHFSITRAPCKSLKSAKVPSMTFHDFTFCLWSLLATYSVLWFTLIWECVFLFLWRMICGFWFRFHWTCPLLLVSQPQFYQSFPQGVYFLMSSSIYFIRNLNHCQLP